jgi:hypothetical protein
VIDEIAVPDRLEEAVGESKREDVLRWFLAEKMIDPKDLALAERLVDLVVQPDRAVEVVAERLLHDHSGQVHQASRPQRLDHRDSGPRRDAQIVEACRTY